MNSEFIATLDYLEREKGIKREVLIEAVSSALLSASKKAVGPARDLRIDINAKTGEGERLIDYFRKLNNQAAVDFLASKGVSRR